MKRHLISLVLFVLSALPFLASVHGDHGKYYSVKDGGGSSGILMIIAVIAFGLYCYFCSGNKDSK